MIKLSLQTLDAQAREYNRLVMQTDGIDNFCSSTHWIIPAHRAFASYRPLWIRQSTAGFVVLSRSYHPSYGLYLEPLEAIWGLACPFITAEPEVLIHEFSQELFADRRNRSPLVLSGLPREGALLEAVIDRLSPRLRLTTGQPARRYRAGLEGGYDGFLSRRSAHFRANLRRGLRQAEARGITFDYYDRFASWADVERLYERIVQIETRSWKGKAGSGLLDPAMREFYRLMLARIWLERSVRAVIARLEGVDIGFVFGAIFDGIYRGLQMSFDEAYSHLSLGNLLQATIIRHLCEERCGTYDLGAEVPYKEHWAEQVFETVQLIAC